MRKRIIALLLTTTIIMTIFVGCTQESEGQKKSVDNKEIEEVEGNEKDTGDKEKGKVEAVDKKKVFVSPEWVKSVIDGDQEESEKYIILEAAWGTAKDSPDYNNGHIPGAIHVDTASIEEDVYWNIKTPEEVEAAMLEHGITKDTTVILYGPNVSGTARVAYAYLWAGVENIKILDGSLDAWVKAGYDLETTPNDPVAEEKFGAKVPANPELRLSIDDTVKKLEEDDNFRLVSIRSYDEFIGKTSGYSYIPKGGEPKGAVWGKDEFDYLNEDGTIISFDEMKRMWEDLDFSIDNELSFYCGTGWRAALPLLIMYENGYTNMNMYDGGWLEWQMNDELPVQLGDPAKDEPVYTKVGELSNDKATK